MTLQDLIANRPEPLFCGPADFLDETLDRMVAANVDAAIVIEATGEIVGLLTHNDVVKAVQATSEMGDSISREHVFVWMSEGPILIDPMDQLDEALAKMNCKNDREAIVIENGRPVTIVTISDVLFALHEIDLCLIHEMRGMLFRPLSNTVNSIGLITR